MNDNKTSLDAGSLHPVARRLAETSERSEWWEVQRWYDYAINPRWETVHHCIETEAEAGVAGEADAARHPTKIPTRVVRKTLDIVRSWEGKSPSDEDQQRAGEGASAARKPL